MVVMCSHKVMGYALQAYSTYFQHFMNKHRLTQMSRPYTLAETSEQKV